MEETTVEEAAVAAAAALRDPARLRALDRTGLGAEPDPGMDFFADWVRRGLGVPVALVSLVRADRQVLPGVAGLPAPWADTRTTPLSHSFCRHVVTTAAPLVVDDATTDPRVAGSLAVSDLEVAAYAGMPLTDEDGRVLGSLCAIDTRPRTWNSSELRMLNDLARACSAELRLRLARFDAHRTGARRDRADASQQRLLDRSQMLLAASQAFTDTTTAEDVRDRLHELTATELAPTFVSIVLRDGRGRLARLGDVGVPGLDEPFAVDTPTPSAVAVRERRMIHYPDRFAFDAAFPAAVRQTLRALGLHTVVAVPLPGIDGPAGALVLGWDHPDAVAVNDLLTIVSIAGYAAQAFGRADVLHRRVVVARAMQDAMLTILPPFDGIELAARYEPADSRENVGGDWYDAISVAVPDQPGQVVLTVSVGDITGHTLQTATLMGQARSMLRQAAWMHGGGSPTAILRAFDAANIGTGLAATGTAVLAHLRPHADRLGAGWSMEWTNAGHPAPILVLPDGAVVVLDRPGPDPLFGYPSLADHPRTDRHDALAPGTVVFLYTDGLVEHRGHTLDEGIDALVELLGRLHGRPTREIVDTTVATLAPDARDDVVAFAIRLPTR